MLLGINESDEGYQRATNGEDGSIIVLLGDVLGKVNVWSMVPVDFADE